MEPGNVLFSKISVRSSTLALFTVPCVSIQNILPQTSLAAKKKGQVTCMEEPKLPLILNDDPSELDLQPAGMGQGKQAQIWLPLLYLSCD